MVPEMFKRTAYAQALDITRYILSTFDTQLVTCELEEDESRTWVIIKFKNKFGAQLAVQKQYAGSCRWELHVLHYGLPYENADSTFPSGKYYELYSDSVEILLYQIANMPKVV